MTKITSLKKGDRFLLNESPFEVTTVEWEDRPCVVITNVVLDGLPEFWFYFEDGERAGRPLVGLVKWVKEILEPVKSE